MGTEKRWGQRRDGDREDGDREDGDRKDGDREEMGGHLAVVLERTGGRPTPSPAPSLPRTGLSPFPPFPHSNLLVVHIAF